MRLLLVYALIAEALGKDEMPMSRTGMKNLASDKVMAQLAPPDEVVQPGGDGSQDGDSLPPGSIKPEPYFPMQCKVVVFVDNARQIGSEYESSLTFEVSSNITVSAPWAIKMVNEDWNDGILDSWRLNDLNLSNGTIDGVAGESWQNFGDELGPFTFGCTVAGISSRLSPTSASLNNVSCEVTTAPAGRCPDIPPGQNYSCVQQNNWGKCSEPWMDGYCQVTCGTCTSQSPKAVSQSEECNDIPPSPNYTCEQQKIRGKCSEPWMEGYCLLSCGKCGSTPNNANLRGEGASH